MMHYQQVRDILYRARTAAQNMAYYTSELTAPAEIRQSLTALYGSERTSGGKQAENPALVAIMMQEDRIEQARKNIAEAAKVFSQASNLLLPIRDERILCVMQQYFLSGWSLKRISELHEWESISSAQKLKDKGMAILRQWYK